MTLKFAGLILLGMCLLLPGPAWGGIVLNGGFEFGNFTSWTQSGNTGFTGVATGGHSGSYYASFGPIGSPGFIEQTLGTTPGEIYNLSFWESADGGFAAQVYWNGALVYNAAGAPGDWTLISVNGLVATGNSTFLQLGFRNDPDFTGVDDIDVVAAGSAVPEPSTVILVALGMAAFALNRRRRGLARPQR